MALISVSIVRATTQTYKMRDIVQVEGDFYNNIRLAMAIFERDYSHVFSPLPMNPQLKKNPYLEGSDADSAASANSPRAGALAGIGGRGKVGPSADDAQKLDTLMNSELGQTTDYWLGAFDLTAMRGTHMTGSDQKLMFITSSHQRMYKNSPESEYAKVRYELRNDTDENAIEGTQVLTKIEDTNVFDDVELKTKNERTYLLLSGVKAFKIQYYRHDKKQWNPTWDNARDDLKGKFPDLVKITISVIGPKRLTFDGEYIFRTEQPFAGLPASF